jgi:hypothetical protein
VGSKGLDEYDEWVVQVVNGEEAEPPFPPDTMTFD